GELRLQRRAAGGDQLELVAPRQRLLGGDGDVGLPERGAEMAAVVQTDRRDGGLRGGGALGERARELLEEWRRHATNLDADRRAAYWPEGQGARLTWGRTRRAASPDLA